MSVRATAFWFVALVGVAAAVGCTPGNFVAPPVRGGSGPTAAPTPTGSSAPASGAPSTKPSSAPTAAPTTVPTSAPTPVPTSAPTPVPTSAPTPGPTATGSVVCTAPAVSLGTFTSIDASGTVSGSTFNAQSGDWEAIAFVPPTPTPTPTTTASPQPTPIPTVSPVPTATPTPVMVTEYLGEYTVTSYGGNAAGGGTYTAAATNGCFFLILEQPVGGTAGQIRHRLPLVTPTASPNAFADGEPNESGLEAETFLDEGSLTSFTITNLTPISGSGSFSFTNSADATATGTVTITGSESEIATPDAIRRIEALERARRALVIRAR